MLSPILKVRSQCSVEEIDYVYLTTTLQDWAAPRNVISRLVKNKDLIRVKKGIYVFGPSYAKRPYSLEILANKIYGPSYISKEYALSYWGLIPEGVQEVTSMTTGRKREFSTPVGRFSYTPLDPKFFSIGVTYIAIHEVGALMATPEKALVDLLKERNEKRLGSDTLSRILFEDLRIEQEEFFNLKKERFEQMEEVQPSPLLKALLKLLTDKDLYA